MKLKLSDISNTRIPQSLGLCSGDLPAISNYLNQVVQQFVMAFGETGFWGCWAKMVFNVDCASPYITLPSQFARAVNADQCVTPILISNEWAEYLADGVGLQRACDNGCGASGMYDRGMVVTAFDLPASNNLLRVYYTDVRDIGKRILFSGALDQNQNPIYSQDGVNRVQGFYLTLEVPFTTSAFIVTAFSAVAKDQTYGDLILKAVDATTGEETFLSRYGARETNPEYRRYLLKRVPPGCCVNPQNPHQLQVTAMCKYEYRPVTQPSDFLLCGNVPALKFGAESVRFSEMDSPQAQQMSLLKWSKAIQLLNQEIVHYLGEQPAVTVSFGYGRGLRRDFAGFW